MRHVHVGHCSWRTGAEISASKWVLVGVWLRCPRILCFRPRLAAVLCEKASEKKTIWHFERNELNDSMKSGGV